MQELPRTFSVVILYNCADAQSETGITEVEIGRVKSALDAAGYDSTILPILHSSHIECALQEFVPTDCIVLNLFEGSGDDLDREYILAAAALERAGFTFTGSSSGTMSLDKAVTKQLLVQHNLSVPRYQVLQTATSASWGRLPAIVKPLNQHGSIGISQDSVVETAEELAAQVQYVVESLHGPALVEEFVDGPEFCVSLWGNGCETTVLPLIRFDYSGIPDRQGRLKTFDAKWRQTESASLAIESVVAPIIEEELEWRIARLAQNAYAAVGLRDYGRIDIRQEGDELYVLDVNANPDIVSEGCSLVRSASSAGYEYDQIISRLLGYAYGRPGLRRMG